MLKVLQQISSPRRLLQTQAKLSVPDQKALRSVWLVARSLCLYRCWDMHDVPVPERENAIQLAIQQWSPFKQTGHFIAWVNSFAQVWCWDEGLRQSCANDADIQCRTILPETIYTSSAEDTGFCLRATAEGNEGQYWEEGVLRASHWWPEQPLEDQWTWFQRSVGKVPETSIPLLENHELNEAPWKQARLWRQWVSHGYEPLLVKLFAALLIIGFTWQLTTLWKLNDYNKVLQNEISQLSKGVGALLDARNAAIIDHERLQSIQQLAKNPKQLLLMKNIIKAMPDQETTKLVSWNSTGSRLQIVLQGDALNASNIIKAYESLPAFSEVVTEVQSRPTQLLIGMKVDARALR